MEKDQHISKEVDRLYRESSGKLMTSLLSFFNLSQLELAEDIVQSTFLAALNSWSVKGLPHDPLSWLFKVCKNKALNELNRKQAGSTFDPSACQQQAAYSQLEQAFLPYEIRDNQLRLLFAACHPHFSPMSRIILILKTLAGFKVGEIAKGLGIKTEAVKKNLARTRRQVRESNMQFHVPFRMQSGERLGVIHQVLYLIFNEGYRASAGDRLIKTELCLEALRMTRSLLDEEQLGNSDTKALYALMLLNVARFEARMDAAGEIIDLKQQDRSRWDRSLIVEGIRYIREVKEEACWSTYHFEAAIASIHCISPDFKKTNWQAILTLYDRLLEVNPSPFISLNRTIALHYAGEPLQALKKLLELKGLEGDPLYFMALADICESLGRKQEAIDHFLSALHISALPHEQKYLKKKVEELQQTI